MAVNTNKRIAVKHVRDKAKAAYEKKDHCYICNTHSDLELHHTHSITLLLNKWAAAKNYDISTDEGILAVRDEFISEHNHEIYDEVYTLCNKHHVNLHRLFGKSPPLGSAGRQAQWIERQKQKVQNGDESDRPQSVTHLGGVFSKYTENCNLDLSRFYRKLGHEMV